MTTELELYSMIASGEFVGLVFFTGFLVFFYAARNVKCQYIFLAIFAWSTTFSGVVITPYDIFVVPTTFESI